MYHLKFQIILTVQKFEKSMTATNRRGQNKLWNRDNEISVSYPSKLISLFGKNFKKYSLSQKNEYIQPKVLQRLDKIPYFQITLDFLPFLASFFLCWYSSYSNRLGYYCCCKKKMRINFNFTKKRRKYPKKGFSVKVTYLLLLLLLFELMTVTTFITVLIVTAAKAKNWNGDIWFTTGQEGP